MADDLLKLLNSIYYTASYQKIDTEVTSVYPNTPFATNCNVKLKNVLYRALSSAVWLK